MFIPTNVVLSFSINDSLDVTVQISSMLEKQLNEELSQIIVQEDIPTLIEIYKLKNNKEDWSKSKLKDFPMEAIKH